MTSIHFLGFREDVAAILKGCDVVVAPTRYEPYGLGVHEALCCGVPALVSAQAGVAERYPEALKELLVLNPDDAGELAERLGRWSANREDYRSRVRPLGDQLRAGSWAAMGQRMVELMEASRDMECGQR
jgi:glycosyltransferase involved in cell wall biosynthesis